MEASPALAAIATMRAAYDELAGLELDTLTHPELLSVLGDLETLTRRLPTQSHRILTRLAAEASPVQFGATSWREVLSGRLRISRAEARRRLADATELGPRTALTGQPLDPTLAGTAAAQAQGSIGAEHVRIIRAFFDGCRTGWTSAPGSRPRPPWCRPRAGWIPTRCARPPNACWR